MRFSELLAASSVATLVAAHGDAPIPRMFGMPKHMKSRNLWAGHKNAAVPVEAPKLQVRQGGDANNRCGPSFGGASCAAGFCCSAEGYCGNTKEHCAAPDCLINYGPGCDANQTPNGATTRNDARPQLGNIEYGGVGIRSCLKPKTVAITYDDGPYIYTEDVMAEFAKYNAKATFFITGNNLGKGAIDENWSGVIQSMYSKGHQIASHTWSHQNLDQITSEQRYDQMVKNEMALRNILGKYPTYMRPPYSACDTAECQRDLKALGYVITSFDLDTDDYNQLTTAGMEVAKGNFKTGVDGAIPDGSQLSIAHDIHELTAHNLTPYMLKYVYDNGFTAVTVGECMNDPVENWYRDSTPAPPSSSTRSSSAPAPTPTGPTSTDGNCGTVNPLGNGQSCVGFVGPDGLSECCSQYGYCGRSSDYCQTGCNPLFGKCGTQPSLSSSLPASVSATSSGPVPTPTGPTSTDGNCGTVNPLGNGQSCIGWIGLDGTAGNCCSEYGYCGNTDAYCGTGCNPLYGKCGPQVSASSSQSVSASASSSISRSVSSSAISSSASPSVSKTSSASPSTSKTSSASASSSISKASSSASSSVSKASSSASPSISKTSSASASPSVSKASSSSASPSVSKSASSSAAQSSSASVSKSSSASVSASKSASSSAAQSSSVPASASKSSSSVAQSSSASVSKPASSTPVSTSASVPRVSSTPAASSSKGASSTPVQPSASSSVVKPSTASSVVVPTPSSEGVHPHPSTVSTVVRASSTPCTTSSVATPTPSKPVSKDGKCGKDNGGQTCAGYMNGLGWKIECCCKESGRCSTDPWACGVGCDKAYGNCFS